MQWNLFQLLRRGWSSRRSLKDRFSFVVFSGYAPDVAKVNIITMVIMPLAKPECPQLCALFMIYFSFISLIVLIVLIVNNIMLFGKISRQFTTPKIDKNSHPCNRYNKWASHHKQISNVCNKLAMADGSRSHIHARQKISGASGWSGVNG